MKHDWLAEATRAARDVGVATPHEATQTRRRIVYAMRPTGRWGGRISRWLVLAAAALLVGSAWAAGPSRARVAAWLGIAATRATPGATMTASSPTSTASTPMATASAASPAGAPPADVAPSGVTEPSPANAPGLEAATSPAVLQSTPTRAATVAASPAGAPMGPPSARASADLEALYARAHALHFRAKDPGGALDAWDRYLAAAPADARAGLVLEARYNRAICLLRLQRYDEARAALRPFADGAWGDYRRDDARALLDQSERF
jgi:tetratricopeptide (TPR) repeat protein